MVAAVLHARKLPANNNWPATGLLLAADTRLGILFLREQPKQPQACKSPHQAERENHHAILDDSCQPHRHLPRHRRSDRDDRLRRSPPSHARACRPAPLVGAKDTKVAGNLKGSKMLEFLGFALFVALLFTCVHFLMGALADKPGTSTRDTIQYR